MHKEKIIYEGKEIEVETFHTVVHLLKGKKHALSDIGHLLKEEERHKVKEAQGLRPGQEE